MIPRILLSVAALLVGGCAWALERETPPAQRPLTEIIASLPTVSDAEARAGIEAEMLASAKQRKPAEGQAKPLLEALSVVKNEEVRDSLYRVLGKLGDPESMEELVAAAKAGSVAAVEGLGHWPDLEPESLLYDLAKHGADAALREKALDGYIRILRMPHETPSEKTVARLAEAMKLATTPQQRRAVIAGLSELPSAKALAEVQQYADDKALHEDATLAIQRIRAELEADPALGGR